MLIPHRMAFFLIVAGFVGSDCVAMDESKSALLIGVSSYPNLAIRYQLAGPQNDVELMRELLIERFSFSSESITVLSEESGSSAPLLLPTRANIEREFLRLAEAVQTGDEVVVFFAGHGAQQPEQAGGVPETDGLDEIFLPRDVDRWEQKLGVVPNAINDNQIAEWLELMQAKDAHIWAIFDCCHSGDMSRGVRGQERFVDPVEMDGLAIPPGAMTASLNDKTTRGSASKKQMTGQEDGVLTSSFSSLDNLAVLYACQSHEKAIELPFPAKPAEKSFGLLTYSLRAALSKAKGPISYRELTREVYHEYVAAGRMSGPTVLAEGADLDRLVLGTASMQNSETLVTSVSNEEMQTVLQIDVGRLHGMTTGTVLAVFSLPEQNEPAASKKLLGHVRVTDVDLAKSIIIPCAYSQSPQSSAHVLSGGRCEIVELEYGDFRLPISVAEAATDGGARPESKLELISSLAQEIAIEKDSMISFVANDSVSRWSIVVAGESVTLSPSQLKSNSSGELDRNSTLGPFVVDAQIKEVLRQNLTRVARAENLMRLASVDGDATRGGTDASAVKFSIQVDLIGKGPINALDSPVRVCSGDIFDMSIKNTGIKDIDLTVLYIDCRMGITAIYPSQNRVNRIRARQSARMPSIEFTTGPAGRGHFVFIALASDGPPVDFSWLARTEHPKERASRTPMDALLETAAFGGEQMRGAPSKGTACLDILPVDVAGKP